MNKSLNTLTQDLLGGSPHCEEILPEDTIRYIYCLRRRNSIDNDITTSLGINRPGAARLLLVTSHAILPDYHGE